MKSISFLIRLMAALGGLAATAATVNAADQNDTVMRAMRDELERSKNQLQLGSLEKPYFIAYRVQERQLMNAAATFGSTTQRNETRHRTVTVEVRVGDPTLDNTNFQAGMMMGPMLGGSAMISLDDDYDGLRRDLWLATDRAYKQAVEQLSRKKAALENKTQTDDTPDFSAQAPATIVDRRVQPTAALDQAVALARELSAVFRDLPDIATSTVMLGSGKEITRYVNTEGSSFVREETSTHIIARAATQAADGFPIEDHFVVYRRGWDGLPPKAELLTAMQDLGNRITRERQASLLEQYNGPVLFEGQAAVELFAQAFAPQLVGRKTPVADSSNPMMSATAAENPFLDKIGATVLPGFLTVVDDPTLEDWKGKPLVGATQVDDEGVPTRPVSLVEKGRLKTLLVSRSPVRGVPVSSGSFHGNGPAPSNLIVTAAEGLASAALKAELLKIAQQRGRPFGVIIRRIGNPQFRTERVFVSSRGNGVRIEPAIEAVKVFPDGHEEPLRNVEISGFEASAFKDILSAGAEPTVLALPFRGGNLMSYVVPSLLFEEVTLKKPSGQIPKPPLAKHPFFDKS
jgi:hypothetical protein